MRERMSKTLETKIMNKTILVTGSSGFIGTNLLEMLNEKKIPFTEEEDLNNVLPEVDVLYMTRIQKERISKEN